MQNVPGWGGGRPDGRFLRPCRGGLVYGLVFYPGVPLRSTPGYDPPPLRGKTNGRVTHPATGGVGSR
jgi:hypothetical protein